MAASRRQCGRRRMVISQPRRMRWGVQLICQRYSWPLRAPPVRASFRCAAAPAFCLISVLEMETRLCLCQSARTAHEMWDSGLWSIVTASVYSIFILRRPSCASCDICGDADFRYFTGKYYCVQCCFVSLFIDWYQHCWAQTIDQNSDVPH